MVDRNIGAEMHKFKVRYVRTAPAGAIKFDPNLEFIVTQELNANTPEQAVEELQNSKSWMNIRSIEQMD